MNRAQYFHDIHDAIVDLLALNTRTAAPNSLPLQFVGTAIDDVAASLFAPLNGLWFKRPLRPLSSETAWRSHYRATLANFYIELHATSEQALKTCCKLANIEVRSAQAAGIEVLAAAIRPHLMEHEEAQQALAKLLQARARPSFEDYLLAVLGATSLSKKQRKSWTKFFKALGVLRNRAAHSNESVPKDHILKLEMAGLGMHVGKESTLVLNPKFLKPTADRVLEFFELISTELHLPAGPAEVQYE